MDSVYFSVGCLDKNRHSQPISELLPVIIRPPIISGMRSVYFYRKNVHSTEIGGGVYKIHRFSVL